MPHDRVALVRSADVVGVNIINSADEVIGRVEDVLFDETGNIHYVILSVYNDVGETPVDDYAYYGVEWDAFAISRGEDFTETGTQTGTGAQPGAQTGTQTGFETGVLLYQEDTIDLTGAMGLDDTLLDSDDIFYSATADDDVDTRLLDGLFRLSTFANFRLFNPDLVNPETDEDLGVVEDMLVNVDEGIVQYAIAQIGGWLGIGQTAVIIPWERIAYNMDEEQFLINATEEELENAPALELDRLEEWQIDPEWERETESYWGTGIR
jgi:sporulation protein YlmC with PRC-barrel domain